MKVLRDGTIMAGGIKIGMASRHDVESCLADGTLKSTGDGCFEYIQENRTYTQEDVKEELRYLAQHGYLNLPEGHLLNGASMSAWKNLWNKLF